MCELIITVQSRGDDAHWVKRGTVVETLEDGHDYGVEELTNPLFRIIKIPGAPVAWGRAFMGRAINNVGTEREVGHRAFFLNVDHPSIPAALRRYLDDDARVQPAFVADEARIPRAALAALKTARVYADPLILHDPGTVIRP